MMTFEDREDVEEWLDRLDYEGFWKEMQPFGLKLQPRESCDRQIASGSIDEGTVLYVLKGMARLEITLRHQLPPRDRMPWHALH